MDDGFIVCVIIYVLLLFMYDEMKKMPLLKYLDYNIV